MRLGVSDAEISQRIVTNPTFQNQQGQFDRARFEDAMRNAGFNEQRFVAEQRNLTLTPADHRFGLGQYPAAERLARRPQSVPEPGAQHRLSGARSGASRRHSAADRRKSSANISMRAKSCSARRNSARSRPWWRRRRNSPRPPKCRTRTSRQIFDTYRNRYITPERRHIEQMAFPTMAEAQAASDAHQGRPDVCGARRRARPQGARPRSRHGAEIDHHRSGRGRCRLRAQGRRSERAGARHVRRRHRHRVEDHPRGSQDLRRRRAADPQRDRLGARQENRPGHPRQDRGRPRRRRIARGRGAETEAARRHLRRHRPLRPRSRRQADRKPSPRRRSGQRRVRDRRRRRQRSARGRRRLYLVRRRPASRRRASAISTR